MKEVKGENTKDEHSSDPSTETITVSEGDRNSYDQHTKHNFSSIRDKIRTKRKSKQPNFYNPSNPSTIHMHTAQNTSPCRSSRFRRKPSNKVKNMLAFTALAKLIRKKNHTKIPFPQQLDRILSLTTLPNGEINYLHPLALIAGTNANPNILNHREAMKADDKEQFLSAMEEEIERMIEKGSLK